MTDDETRACIEPFADRIGGPIRALHELMRNYGSIDSACLPVVADVFNISQAEVRGIVSFYSDFNRQPARHRIRLCQAEACQALGSRRLTREIETRYATRLDERTQEVMLESVYCLGLCAVAPAAEIDGRLVGRATADKLEIES